jgi:hypothetical protein
MALNGGRHVRPLPSSLAQLQVEYLSEDAHLSDSTILSEFATPSPTYQLSGEHVLFP